MADTETSVLAETADALHAAVRKKKSDAVRALGEELNARGGFALMQAAHRELVQRHRHSARLVEMLWTGIGVWRG